MQPKKIALLAREAALNKKAENPVVLDVARLTSVANYFLVTHGNSDRQVRAIAENICDELEEKAVKVWHREGVEAGHWALLDYGAVIIHVFHRDTRDFYGLERLWGEASRL